MSEAKYLGLTANQLAKVASNLEAENAKLRDERDRMYKANVEKNGEILRLLEENARLKQELEAVGTAAYLYGRTDLAGENAKLRELVKDLNKWLWNGADCTECPFTAKCDLNAAFESDLHSNICIGWSEIHDRMRELGIEVDK